MSEEEKRKRVQLIADTVQHLLQQIDMFTNMMTSDDLDILTECKDKLQEKILHNESAMAFILALGGNYDSTEDEMKIETLDCLIKLMRTRNKYKEEMLKQQESLKKRREVLKMLGL